MVPQIPKKSKQKLKTNYIIKQIRREIKMKKLAILNTTILTADGEFSLKTITLDDAKKLVNENEILSAVGHESTAQVLTELLGVEIPLNRIQFIQESGQQALCFKLSGRPREGAILSKEEVETMGYEFKLLEMR